ncbi:MAG: putative toxin-antitoxin system toxin component, PIN family [Chloroflexi bacterium]|nr:putative toxin-antitoxin system toxin component, PIN family [Chloroflexota bacterium]
MRVAIDTNVLISAIIKPQNRMGLVIVHLRKGDYVLLYSEELLDELTEVLARPKLRKYGMNPEMVSAFIDIILAKGESVDLLTVLDVCRDPDDNLLLSLAVDGEADYVVSGDKDLLDLVQIEDIPIIAPAEFLAKFE